MNKLIFFLLYFSEGGPIGFIWWALPAILEQKGYSVTQTATISAIAVIPWSLKFAFAPIIDLLSVKTISIKKQLLFFQVFLAVAIYFIPKAMNSGSFNLLLIAVIIQGIFAALQDICIDALAVKSIPEDEIGKVNAIMQAGMLIGRSIFGGAGVYIVAKFGINIYIYLLMSSVWVILIFLQNTDFSKVNEVREISIKEYFWDFYRLVKRFGFWLLIGITYFSGFSYNGISTISSAMLSKMGASSEIHALTYAVFLPIVMISGALLGGFFSDKLSSTKVLVFNLSMCIITSSLVGINYDLQSALHWVILSYVLFYFFIGATTTTLYAFLMKYTSKEFAALEFSIFMGVVNLCDSSTSYLTGQLIETFSYFQSTMIIGAFSCLSILLLWAFMLKTNPRQL